VHFFIANFKDPIKRRGVPSGFLAFHDTTKQIIAIGENSLSYRLFADYCKGFKYPYLNEFQAKKTLICPPRNLDKFKEFAPGYYAKHAALLVNLLQEKVTLGHRIFLTEDLALHHPSQSDPYEDLVLNLDPEVLIKKT